jgi:hypothetical protein
METVRAVKDPEPDPKAGKPRARSGVSFPYWDLDSVTEVARVIHERAGGVCDTAQLATMLGYSGISNGSFRTRVSAAKMFGVIEDADDRRLRVSARGRRIVAPVTDADGISARAEAFLAVDLFKRVFDRFNGTTLPEQVGLRNLLTNEYQVVPDRVAPTVRILLDSAEQAGLFQAAGNRSRMVMPLAVGVTPASPPPPVPPASEKTDTHRTGGNGGGGDGGTTDIDPAIVGLLKRLPPVGTAINAKRRKVLIDAFTNVVAFLYPDAEDGDHRNDHHR